MKDKLINSGYILFSVLFAISLVIGKRVYINNKVAIAGPADFILLLALILTFSILTYFVILAASEALKLLKSKSSNKGKVLSYLSKPFSSKKPFIQLLIFTAIIFIFWLPCFLSYYPMMDSYDIFYKTPYWFSQHSQAVTGNFIKHHSVLHTFFWRLAVKTSEGLNVLPFIPYAIGQSLFISVIFAKSLVFINKKGLAKIYTILALLFYLMPVNAIFSQIPTKDVSIAPLVLLLTMNLYCLFTNDECYKKIGGIILAILETLLCCLLRNNFIYAFVVFAIIIFFMQKKARKPFLIIAITSVLSFALINGPLYKALGVTDGEKHEALSVPIEQLAYTLINSPDKLSESDKNEIMMYFPKYEIYNPRFADPVKDNSNDLILEENLTNFIKLWVKVGLKCPGEYIDSFLTLNIPYWYIKANPIDPYSQRQYIETGEYDDHTPLISKGLLDFYEKEGDFEGINSLPVIRIIFLLATPMWLLIFGLCRCISCKKKDTASTLLLLFLYMLTFLLGPVSCMRYIYPLFVTYPVILFFIFKSEDSQIK